MCYIIPTGDPVIRWSLIITHLRTTRLRSASRHQLLVPRYQLSSLGRRSFAVAGPMTWNSLSADLRDPTCSDESFRRSLKTFLFAKYLCVQRNRGFSTTMRYINRHYLSIYLSTDISATVPERSSPLLGAVRILKGPQTPNFGPKFWPFNREYLENDKSQRYMSIRA